MADPLSSNTCPVRARHISVDFGSHRALADVSLEVAQGEIVAIMGPSGSGKSTLFNAVLGLLQPSAGEVEIYGENIYSLDNESLYGLRRQMGVAFQGGALINSLNLIENVELPLKRHTNLAAHTIRIMARMKLEMMNLIGVEERMPSELSGGMLKRASLARAIVMDPRLLFFDEPSAGLDPISAAELDEHLLQLRDAHRMTIVLVTHELTSALHVADRIAVLHEGKLLGFDSPQRIRRLKNPVIQDLFLRRPGVHNDDLDEYVERLTN